MWIYEKKLQYPVNIRRKDLKMAKNLLAQYGGSNGQLGAAIQYLNQRYTMPDGKGRALLTDIGTEELGHIEMISTMVYQLLQGATEEELKNAGLSGYYTEHGLAPFPIDADGVPFTAAYVATTGDVIADIESNMASEQKARATYEHLMNQTDDSDLLAPLAFLRQREIVHYDRFKELRDSYLNTKM